MKAAGGNLVLVAVPGRVMEMLQLTQMILPMKVCGTVAEAEAALNATVAGA